MNDVIEKKEKEEEKKKKYINLIFFIQRYQHNCLHVQFETTFGTAKKKFLYVTAPGPNILRHTFRGLNISSIDNLEPQLLKKKFSMIELFRNFGS